MKSNISALGKLAFMTMLSVVAGCGTASQPVEVEPAKPAVDMTQPITIKFFNNASNEIFEEEIGKRVRAKFPNIKIEPVGNGFTRTNMEKLVAAGEVPDLFWIGFQENISDIKQLGLSFDLAELIKRDKYDLNRFEDIALQMVKNQGDKGELFALPWQTASAVMFYNKDLFDKFAVPYPKDGMTWQEAIELGKKMSRTENGVEYKGFDPGRWSYYYQQYGVNMYDPVTGKATYMSDPKWRTIMQFFQDAYTSQGTIPAKIQENRNPFMVDKTVAMLPWAAYFQPFLAAKDTGLNFDMVSVPTPPDAKGQGISPAASILLISPLSKYKEQGWEILKFLASDEVETANSRIGFPPAIKLQAAKDQFGADLPGMQSLNMKAVFYNKPTVQPAVKGEYQSAAFQPFTQMMQDVGMGRKDINTALRDAQDVADKAIQEVKAR
ncbi:hypothetical protein ACFFNY_25205 [Paenibacillus hodogayensis]|uniref:Sugar ABC transporter substrate-binding protein n=1 Tax=Paenibacillus hodogayensis TaxID=279208 RepID=A0ABV5W2X8_9BACL